MECACELSRLPSGSALPGCGGEATFQECHAVARVIAEWRRRGARSRLGAGEHGPRANAAVGDLVASERRGPDVRLMRLESADIGPAALSGFSLSVALQK